MTLYVHDNGPGVPEGLRQKIFDPFFTTRSNGTGLGLAVVQSVARAHGGARRSSPRRRRRVLRHSRAARRRSSCCAAAPTASGNQR